MGEFDILEYDYTLFNDNGLEIIIENRRAIIGKNFIH